MEILDIGGRRLVMKIFSSSGHCRDGIIGESRLCWQADRPEEIDHDTITARMDSEKGSRVDIWYQTRGDNLGVKPTATACLRLWWSLTLTLVAGTSAWKESLVLHGELLASHGGSLLVLSIMQCMDLQNSTYLSSVTRQRVSAIREWCHPSV